MPGDTPATLDAMATRRQRLYLVPGDSSGMNRLSDAPQPDAGVAQRVDFGDRSDAGWTPSETVVNQSLDRHLGLVFAGETLQHDTELSGAFSGVLEFTVNKRDVDLAISVFEHDAKGDYTELAHWRQRASYGANRGERRLLQADAPQRLAVNTRACWAASWRRAVASAGDLGRDQAARHAIESWQRQTRGRGNHRRCRRTAGDPLALEQLPRPARAGMRHAHAVPAAVPACAWR